MAATFTAADCHGRGQACTCLITGADGFQVPLITDGEGTDEAGQWRKALCTTMIQSGLLEALTQLGQLGKTHRAAKRRAILALQGYIAGHSEMLEYPRYIAEDFAIGSGPTESQCKGLTARLKGRGRRWHTRAIDAHLAISCLYSNTGQWAAYWPKISMP